MNTHGILVRLARNRCFPGMLLEWFSMISTVLRSLENTTGFLVTYPFTTVFFLSEHNASLTMYANTENESCLILKPILLCKHITSQFTVTLEMFSILVSFANSWEHGKFFVRNKEFVHRKINQQGSRGSEFPRTNNVTLLPSPSENSTPNAADSSPAWGHLVWWHVSSNFNVGFQAWFWCDGTFNSNVVMPWKMGTQSLRTHVHVCIHTNLHIYTHT